MSVLLETKNKGNYIDKVRKKVGFDDMCVVETVGKAGGLAAFWYKEDVVKRVITTTFTIEILIENKEN